MAGSSVPPFAEAAKAQTWSPRSDGLPDVPALMEKLHSELGIASRRLRSAFSQRRARASLGAKWSEISWQEKVWTIPAARMKAGREHRVPLPGSAMIVFETLSRSHTCELVFPSPRGNRPLSHVAMAKVLTRLGVADATVHGFRSAFRDWAGNETNFPREVAEAALAHVVGDKAEQAYRRSDALESAGALMEAWATHCEPSAPTKRSRRCGRKPSRKREARG